MKSAEITAGEKRRLIKAALQARRRAYTPYSKFAVGAAVLAENGKIHAGCNVENASYGLTVCAERVAVWKAVSEGATTFRAIAIAADGKGALVPPCGACRQVLAEFEPALPVLLVDAADARHVAEIGLADLLPRQFRLGK
jgi:cytidine deaminase